MFRSHKKVRQPHISADPLADESSVNGPTPDLSAAMHQQRWPWVHRLFGSSASTWYFVIAVGLIITVGAALIFVIRNGEESSLVETIIKPRPAVTKFYAPLTGAETSEQNTKRPVTAVVIENSVVARPQSGLKDAGIVYEAIAEGGITRFVALYQEARPALIGPVRSVRPYYVEWASAYDPAVAHVGGSYRARQMIASGNYGTDMDQFFNASTFWRTDDREAPHNVYTSFDKLDALREKKGKTSSTFTPFPRQEVPKKTAKKTETPAPTVTSIDIGVSSGSYAVHYDYDTASATYLRSHAGTAHADREGGRIAPRVVIAIKVNEFTALEGTDGNREQVTTTGSGRAYVFQNGSIIEGTWSRDSEKAPLVLKDGSGTAIALARGQTWITAIANSKSVTWK